MTIRPEEAYWFDLYVPREQTVYAVEALANTNLVQLEVDPVHKSSLNLGVLKDTIAQYKQLAKQYAPYLPEPGVFPTAFESTPDEDAVKSLSVLHGLTGEIDSLLEQTGSLQQKLVNIKRHRCGIDRGMKHSNCPLSCSSTASSSAA